MMRMRLTPDNRENIDKCNRRATAVAACPRCHAPAGQLCGVNGDPPTLSTLSGRPHTHIERREAYRAQRDAPAPRPVGRPPGGPGYGGRPSGPTLPCGACGARLTATEWRAHFTSCPKREQPER